MGRCIGLSIVLALGSVFLAPYSAFAESSCTQHDQGALGTIFDGCTDGHEVDVTGTTSRPGAKHIGTPAQPGTGNTDRSRPAPAPKPLPLRGTVQCFADGQCDGRGAGTATNPDPNPVAPADEPAAAVRAVTAADVARYLPALGELHAEPDGWAVVGVPANFWVEVEPVTVQGEVLDEPADVRFTPVAYRWVYGDGTKVTTKTAGASWEDLGQEELTTTDTSHRYRTRGAVDAAVTVLYTAEYRVDGGDWIAVQGAVEADTPDLPVLVVTEHTVLTNR